MDHRKREKITNKYENCAYPKRKFDFEYQTNPENSISDIPREGSEGNLLNKFLKYVFYG